MKKVIYADTITELYWELVGGCRKIYEDFQLCNSGPGHFWTWEEIQSAQPEMSSHPRPQYIDGDNKAGLALESGRSMAERGVDIGLPSTYKRSISKSLLKIEKLAQKR